MRISDIPNTEPTETPNENWQTLSSVCDRLIKQMEEFLKEDGNND